MSKKINHERNDKVENLCFASKPTRYCGEKSGGKIGSKQKWGFDRNSRSTNSRKDSKDLESSGGTVGQSDTIKNSYKDRVRSFFENKSKLSFKKLRRIFKKLNVKSSDSGREIPGCVISSSTLTDSDFPMTESKMTCTSGLNTYMHKFNRRNSPDKVIKSSVPISTEDIDGIKSRQENNRSKANDAMVVEKKKRILPWCMKPVSSPTRTKAKNLTEDSKEEEKTGDKKLRRRNNKMSII